MRGRCGEGQGWNGSKNALVFGAADLANRQSPQGDTLRPSQGGIALPPPSESPQGELSITTQSLNTANATGKTFTVEYPWGRLEIARNFTELPPCRLST